MLRFLSFTPLAVCFPSPGRNHQVERDRVEVFLEAATITTEVAAGHGEVTEHYEILKSWNRRIMLSPQWYLLREPEKYVIHFYKDLYAEWLKP